MPPPAQSSAAVPEGVACPAPESGAVLRRSGPRGRDTRGRAKRRRLLARALVISPAVAILFVDLARRHGRILDLDARGLLFYVSSAVLGLVLWTCLHAVATRERGPARFVAHALLVVGALLAIGGQLYTFDRYQAYVNHRAVLVGTSFLPSVGQQLWFDRWTFARALLPWLVCAVAVPWAGRRLSPMRSRSRGWLCLDLALACTLVAAFVSPDRGAEQGQPPHVMYVSAMGQLARARWDHNDTVERVHPGPRTPERLPALTPLPSRPRNVVFLITESVRAQSVCVEYAPDCKVTPFSNAVVKDRFPLTQMRALDSTTAISLAIMWTGLRPTEPRELLHRAPLLWEYAHAAKIDSSYYTSQNLLFGNSGTWLEGTPWNHHVSATMIEADATYETGADDHKLLEKTLADMATLEEPYLAVVHLSNTHFPYKVDPSMMPFTPQEEATGPGYENEILNRYQDAIYLQDHAVGGFLEGLRARSDAGRTVIVYVSDHGEQMREKGAVGHTGTLFEPEIRIPFWIHAPEGTLTTGERASLEHLRTTPVTSLDVLPTILDLVGLWDEPRVKPFRARMPGESLLRGGSDPESALVLTNCTELWACAFKNWGAMRGTKKLIAHQGDRGWTCYDVARDPAEESPLDVTHCGDLPSIAEKAMGGHPF